MQQTKTVETLRVFALSGSTQSSENSQYVFFLHLSDQVGEWSVYNFGDQLAHRPAMGMLEELAELQEGMNELNRSKALDAVADITIYMADYYSKRGWNMGLAWEDAVRPPWLMGNLDLLTVCNRLIKDLAHCHLKGEQGIRGGADAQAEKMRQSCATTLWYLSRVTAYFGEDYLKVITEVWGTVSKRDWKKNRDDANVVAESQVAAEQKLAVTTGGVQYEVGDDDEE